MLALRTFLAATLVAGVAVGQSFVGSCPIVTTNGIPVGLDHDLSGNLYYTDIGTNDEFGVVNPTTCVITAGSQVNISANSGNPLGITRDGTNLYITDTVGQDVDVYDLMGTYISSFPVATTFPEGIAWSGTTNNLFVVDGTASQVFEYTTAGVLMGTFPVNGTSVDGIAWDPSDNTFWVYDSGTDSIRHYTSAFVEISNAPGTTANGLGAGEGLGLIGNDLYICATGSDMIAHFSLSGVVASAAPYGSGCPTPADWYEQFLGAGTNDLAGFSIQLTPAGGGYLVVPCAMNCFNPNFTNNLNSGDDQLFPALALGFTINVPGAGMVSTVDVDSNGRTGWGLPGSDFTESVSEFLAQNIMAPSWDDYNPASAGGLYFDTFPGMAMATWDQVPQFGNNDSNTFQIQFLASGDVIMSWQAVMDDAITGFSTGVNAPDPGSTDITASVPFLRSGGTPLTLGASNRPIIGTTLNMTTGNIPATAVFGGTVLGGAQINTPIAGAPSGCNLLCSPFPGLLPLNLATGASNISIPNSMALVGLSVCAQSAVIDPTAGGALPIFVSNGLALFVGNT